MTPYPALSFDELRKIGYGWDPIGVLGGADEYDEYLLEAVVLFRSGSSPQDVANFLVDVERKHMGLGQSVEAKERARTAAEAIKTYLDSLQG